MQKRRVNNEMLGFLGRHLLVGIITGWAILFVFIFFDFGSLRTLTHANHLAFLIYPLFMVFFAITFGSCAMGVGIMGLGKTDYENDKGKKIDSRPVFGQMKLAKAYSVPKRRKT